MVLRKHYPTVPSGNYTVKLKNIYGDISKHRKTPIIKLIFEIVVGKYKGNTIISTFISGNPKSLSLFNVVLSHLSQGEDYKFPTELIGKRIGITVGLNRLDDGRILNTTTGFFRI